MKRKNKITGNRGEEMALAELTQKGYLLLARNFRNRFGEIDLVMEDGATVVFVEVKTRVGEEFGLPEEEVSARKFAQVRRMGEVFLIEKGLWGKACRVDVVAIVLTRAGEVTRLTHYCAV
ncbi:MAG: YraN family protein [Patescibacteria group bacterium]